MTGCKISAEQWMLRVSRKCEQKTEMNQGDGYISLIEEKMLYKTVCSGFSPNLTLESSGSQKYPKDVSMKEKRQ